MVEQLTNLLESGGSNPTSPLQSCYQYDLRIKTKREDSLGLFSVVDTPNIDLKRSFVREVDYSTASKIIMRYEWLHSMPHRFAYRVSHGLYFDNILLGVLVYAQPAIRCKSLFSEDYGSKSIIQLSRGACVWWSPKGTASRLISGSFRILNKEGIKGVIAYCTPEAGEVGTIYQACNFLYLGTTEPGKEYWIDNRWVGERSFAHKKEWLMKLPEGDMKDRYTEAFKLLKTRGTLPRHKYLYVVDRDIISKLIVKTFKYPKRDNLLN